MAAAAATSDRTPARPVPVPDTPVVKTEPAKSVSTTRDLLLSLAQGDPSSPFAKTANAFTFFFDFDKSSLRPDHAVMIESIAKRLKADRGLLVRVSGHADGGDPQAGFSSMQRARAVSDGLQDAGIDRDRIVGIDAMGESLPLVRGVTRDPRNRRAEAVVFETAESRTRANAL